MAVKGNSNELKSSVAKTVLRMWLSKRFFCV